MISIAKNHIGGVKVELIVEEELSDKTIGGQPLLHITNNAKQNNSVVLVYSVDTLTFIKAIVTSTSFTEFKDKIKGTWTEKKCITELEDAIKSQG